MTKKQNSPKTDEKVGEDPPTKKQSEAKQKEGKTFQGKGTEVQK